MLNRLSSALPRFYQSRTSKVLAGLIVFYFLFAWLAINPLAKALLPWIAEKQLASRASVESVRFDPLRLTATLRKFALTTPDGAPLAAFDRLVVDIEADGLLHWAWKLKQITLTAPQVHVSISKQGHLNWAALIAKLNEEPSPPDQDLPRLIIENIRIEQGNIAYRDEQAAVPLQAALKPLDVALEGFSTLPEDRGAYLIAAKLPAQGGTLKWKGSLSVNPVASQGTVAIEGLQIDKLMQWVQASAWPLRVSQGQLSSHFDYDFSLPEQHPRLLLKQARVRVEALQGTLPQQRALALQALQLETKQLLLTQHSQMAINAEALALQLEQLRLSDTQSAFSVDAGQVSLPQLSLAMAAAPSVKFDQLALQLRQVQLQRAQKTLFLLPEAVVENVSLDLAAHQASVADIQLNQGQLSATQDRTGLDWQQVFALPAQTTRPPPVDAASTSSAGEPLHWAINHVTLAHWLVTYTDQQLAHPLQASIGDLNIQLALDDSSGVHLKQMQVDAQKVSLQSNQQPAATLARLSIQDAGLMLDKQQIDIKAIELKGLQSAVIRRPDQRLNWQEILSPGPGATPAASAPPSPVKPKPWAVALHRFGLQQAALHIEDQTTATPVVMDVTEAHLEATHMSQDLARPLPVKAGFSLKQGGQFKLQGTVAVAPLKADLQCDLSAWSLKPLAPYVQQVARLRLDDGTASLHGKLQLAAAGNATFRGGFSVDQLRLNEENSTQSFWRWEQLQGEGLTLTLAPNALQLDRLTLSKPQGALIIYPDHSLNLSKVMRPAQNSPTAVATTSTPSTPTTTTASAPRAEGASAAASFPVSVDSVRIQQAELEFADLSLPQAFGTHIHSLGGVINGISSNPTATAQVELDGKVDDYGAARIRGALRPFRATEFTDLRLAFTNLEMNRLTPYSGKFAGRKIESGKLSVDLGYKIKQRALVGENRFVIHKLTLGSKVDSKEAANLPLDLAIAILEDSNGVIDLDLPVSGSLDDPKFSMGGLIWKAFTNVLTKIVTAPFSALGKLFGGSEKLEAIVFDPGTAIINPPELEKLQAVSAALAKRQQLQLGIVPAYDVNTDTRAIRESTLRQQVSTEMGIRLSPDQAPGPIDLNNAKVQSAIRALHDRLTSKGLLKRLTAKLEKVPEGYYAEAQAQLTESIVVSESELQALANARAAAIKKTLLAAGVTDDRLSLQPAVVAKAERDQVPVKLTLEARKH